MRNGRFTPILADKSLVVYGRTSYDKTLIVAVNAGEEKILVSLLIERHESGSRAYALSQDPQLLFDEVTLKINDSKELTLTLPARTGIIVG